MVNKEIFVNEVSFAVVILRVNGYLCL